MKKVFCIIIHIMMSIAAIGIVPASVLLWHIPEYVTIVSCGIVAGTYLLCMIKGTKKCLARIALTVFTLLTLSICVLGNYCNPYWNSIYYKSDVNWYSQEMDVELTQKEAMEDLKYAMHYLNKLHPAFYEGVPEKVQECYEQVLAKLEEKETITICELNQKIEYIFSVLRDGHSYVQYNVKEPHYMKDIYRFNQADYTLVAINDVELEELLQQKEDYYSYEVESWQVGLLKSDLSCLEGLQYLGIDILAGVKYTYASPEGIREEYIYYPQDYITYDEYVKYNNIVQDDTDVEPFVYYEIDKENSIAILTLTSCIYNDEYKACVKEMFEQVKELELQNVAVDIRNNGGGSSFVADEFIRYLDVSEWKSMGNAWRLGWFKIPFGGNIVTNNKYKDLTFAGEVYILTSTNTFSSAMNFADYIHGNDLGTLIGEAPGNTPNGYGDVAMFKLPNSQLFMQLSTKEFFRVDRENSSNLVEPDIACESDAAMVVLYEQIAEAEK